MTVKALGSVRRNPVLHIFLRALLFVVVGILSAIASPAATTITVKVSPSAISVLSGAKQQFTATVQGTSNTAVDWSSTLGTISTSGLFTAPKVTSSTSVRVTAKSAANLLSNDTVFVTVVPPSASVSISPTSDSLVSGATQQFVASVQNTTNTAITWSATAGTISSGGLFRAPSVTSNTTVMVTATSVADTSKRATASVVVAPAAASTNGGCGATTGGSSTLNQSTCGNYAGAPYEDLNTASPAVPPSPFGSGTVHTITGCTTITPAAGDVWRFGANVNDGKGGTNQNCIYFGGEHANDFVIDLAGHTLTGGIKCDQKLGGFDCSGMTIVNGTVNCNIANGSSVSCITLTLGTNPSKSILLSHLTVNNFNSPSSPDGTYRGFEFAILTQTTESTAMGVVPAGANQKTFHGAGIEEAHLTVTPAAGYTGAGYTGQWCARCTAIFNGGSGGVTVEAWNNLLPNNPYVDAEQGIVIFHAGPASIHNNYFPWVPYQGSGDTGRPILLDASGKPFDQAGGQIFNNLLEAYNNRCVRTRLVNNVNIHDNRFEHVSAGTTYPCIQMGGNGDYSEKLNKTVISKNTFTMAGGNAIEAANAYGITANANTFLCSSNCSSGRLAGAWIVDNNVFPIKSATRDAQCLVTLVAPTFAGRTTSLIAGQGLFVNVSGTGSSFNVSATAGNVIKTFASSTGTITYVQSGCSGAASIGAVGKFWISQNQSDAFGGNAAAIYVKNSIVDPKLTTTEPFTACGTANPACLNPPQFTAIQWCNNTQNLTLLPALGGTGAAVAHLTPDTACP